MTLAPAADRLEPVTLSATRKTQAEMRTRATPMMINPDVKTLSPLRSARLAVNVPRPG